MTFLQARSGAGSLSSMASQNRVTFKVLVFMIVCLTLFSCQSTSPKKIARSQGRSTQTPQDGALHSAIPIARDATASPEQVQAQGTHYALATEGKHTTKIADLILKSGGNLADAAVAASFAISVERPQSTGLGGGGFLLFHEAKSGKNYALDFRERAPQSATEKMFLDPQGNIESLKSKDGVLASGTPGLVAGLIEFHKKFGRLSLKRVVQPAIELAQNGFAIYPQLEEALQDRAAILAKNEAAKAVFLHADGSPKKTGEILIQSDLAQTLKEIARRGKEGFYQGKFSENLIAMMKTQKGLITQGDLDSYTVKWKKPIHGKFDELDLYTMPLPSGGGTQVIEFLNIIRAEPRSDALAQGFLSAPAIHFASAALQSTFVDRSHYLGDSDFAVVPASGLISPEYAATQRAWIAPNKARHPDELKPGSPFSYESSQTTHLSFMDSKGNAIATTQTINGWMGSAVVVPGSGVLLNNEMDDFAVAEGASNLFGAVGGRANLIAPRKTPLSSMAPTLLLRNGKAVMALGAPGGTRIVSCVAETILNYFEFHLPLFESIATLRYHHQWNPDVLWIDPPGPSEEVQKQLREMGYKVEIKDVHCHAMAVVREEQFLRAVADPRDNGASAAQ